MDRKQLINVAVAEKLSALRTEQTLGERAARADRSRTLAVLARIGQRNAPMEGDELQKQPAIRSHLILGCADLYGMANCVLIPISKINQVRDNRLSCMKIHLQGWHMSKRRRNHFIPRFLLNRFCSRSEGKKRWIWQADQQGSPKELSTKDVAVSAWFYGNAQTGIEDRFAEYENECQVMLNDIERGTDPNVYLGRINQFVWSLAVRTRSLREGFGDAFEAMLDATLQNFRSPTGHSVIRHKIVTELEKFVDGLPDPQKSAIKEMSKDPKRAKAFLDFVLQHVTPSRFDALASEIVGMLKLEGVVEKATRESHIGALTKLTQAHFSPERFAARHWIATRSDKRLILGDVCVFATAENGSYGSLARSATDLDGIWVDIYLPISGNLLLIGKREEGTASSSLIPDSINQASAEVARQYIYGTECSEEFVELSARIGQRSYLATSEEIGQISATAWKERPVQ